MNFVFFLKGRPMTVISAPFGQPFFTIFDSIIIADATSTAGFSFDSSLIFILQLFLCPPQ